MALLAPVALSWALLPQAATGQISTDKSLDEFGSCFTRLQERAGHAWSFIPDDEGGVFTDQGARGITVPYRLLAIEAGGKLRLLTTNINNRGDLLEAVARCR